jgi:hypothetical protein
MTTLDIFMCGYVKGYVIRTSVHDTGTLCATIIEAFRSLVKRTLTHRRAELDHRLYSVSATKRSHVGVDWGAHTPFGIRDNFQRTAYFYFFWLSCDKFLNIRIRLLWTCSKRRLGLCTVFYSCTDKISLTSVESSSFRCSQSPAKFKRVTSKS